MLNLFCNDIVSFIDILVCIVTLVSWIILNAVQLPAACSSMMVHLALSLSAESVD